MKVRLTDNQGIHRVQAAILPLDLKDKKTEPSKGSVFQWPGTP